ncbi:MAG: hypothetical protein WBG69_05490 [Arcobacteraceae bacterium]
MELLENISHDILKLVDALENILKNVDVNIVSTKRNSQKRTIKQIVGHLIDSASNNTHRVIHLQYRKSPLNFPDYANFGVNDKWIAIQDYNNYNWDDLLQLMKYTNIHIANVIKNINISKLENKWISALFTSYTLEEMIVDYPVHFKIHLDEIKDLIKQ